MSKFVSPLCGCPLLLLALAACGTNAPVPNAAGAMPDNVVGDGPGRNFDVPTNIAAIERARKAAMPAPTDGMNWSWDAARRAASFGPSASAVAFSIECDMGKLVFRRLDAAPQGGKGTMSFTGNGRVASLPAATVGDSSTMSSVWQSIEPPSDLTAAVSRVFDGPGPVEIQLAGTTPLITPPSPVPVRAIAACRA